MRTRVRPVTLLPCPFCGCAPKVQNLSLETEFYPYQVKCIAWSCPAIHVVAQGRTKAEAVKLWNTRRLPRKRRTA